MKTAKTRNRRDLELPHKLALAEALTAGTTVTAPNEVPVRVDVVELDPYVKVIKPSRSSTIYDKIE